MCDRAIAYAMQGMTLESIALRLGVWSPLTLHNWGKKHPEFLKTIKKAIRVAKDWWIETGRLNLYNKNFNNVLWMMNMTNRFGWTRADVHIDKNVKIEENKNSKIEVTITENKAKTIAKILEEAGALPEGASKGVAELLSTKVN